MESFVDILINEVKCRRMLWNRKDKHYYNHLLVDREWNKIARIIGENKEAVKAKWKNLRDTFRKELKKIPDGLDEGSNSVSRYTGTWPHFESMYFLRSVVTLKLQDTNAMPLEAEEFLPSDIVNSDMKSESANYEADDSHLLGLNYESSMENTNIKKRRLDSFDFFNNLDECRKVNVIEERLEEDEDLNFFKSLIPHVKHLPSVSKLNFRSQVQALLVAEITKHQERYKEDAPHSSSSGNNTCSQST